jgi:hypothetical protein
MNDHHIRAALKRKLLFRYLKDPEALVLDELGLRHGRVRADIVVVNSILHGFEVKSDRDTLKRLPDQARIYNAVFDRMTLVVGYRHAYKAIPMVPDWWGIKLVTMGSHGGIYFSDARLPRNNPSPDIHSIAKLLWRDEALALLEEIGAATGFRSKPRATIYAYLSKVANLELVHSRVCQQLRRRIGWRSAERQMLNGD